MKHPDHPVEFKPSLAVYDKDQTYDLAHMAISLFWIKLIDRGEDYSPSNEIQAINSFFGGVPCLFDRHDYTLHPFAKDYSKKLYDKFSKYNNTFLIVDYNLNGYYSRQYTNIDYGSFELTDETFKDYWINYTEIQESNPEYFSYYTITLDIPAHDYDIYLSYYGGRKCSQDWLYEGSYSCFDKSVFRIPKSEESKQVTIRFEGVPQVCSIIPYRINDDGSFFELADIKAIFNQNSKGWLYENLDSLLDLIDTEIQANYKYLDKSLKLEINYNFKTYLGLESAFGYGGGLEHENPEPIQFAFAPIGISDNQSNVVYTLVDLPNWYRELAIFRSANNQLINDNFELDYNNGNNYYLQFYNDYVIPFFKKRIKNINLNFIENRKLLELSEIQELISKNFDNQENSIQDNIPAGNYEQFLIDNNRFSSNFNPYYHHISQFYNRDFTYCAISEFTSTFDRSQAIIANNQSTENTFLINYTWQTHYVFTVIGLLLDYENSKLFLENNTLKFDKKYKIVLNNNLLQENNYYIINNTEGHINRTSKNSNISMSTVFDYYWQNNVFIRPDLDFTHTQFYPITNQITPQLFNDTEPQEFFDTSMIYLSELELYNLMTDSQRTKEIWQALNADKYAWIDDNGTAKPATHSLGWKIDKLAQAFGLLFDLAGNIQSLRQSKKIESGSIVDEGYYIGQFGINQGGSTSPFSLNGGVEGEERLGLIYEIKSNQFTKDPASGNPALGSSGYVLVETVPQLLHVMLQDLDKSLGLQELGAYIVKNPNYYESLNPNDNPDPYFTFEGLGDLIKEIAYTLSSVSQQATQANLGVLKTQASVNELFGALGLPTVEKTILLTTNQGNQQEIKFSAFNPEAMSIADLHFIALQNLALINQATIELNYSEK